MRVVGAGLGRTGTNSLKIALEHLLGKPCYHMFEAWERPEHFEVWTNAANGSPPDWHEFLSNYGAAVDSPAYHFWQELAEAYPDAPILLSTRDTEAWWHSASETIVRAVRIADHAPFLNMLKALNSRSGIDLLNGTEQEIKAGYDAHNASVRALADPDRQVAEPGPDR